MSKATLTDLAVKALRPRDKEYWKTAGGNLYVRVQPEGGKAWYVRKLHHGRMTALKIGEYPKMGLRDARLEVDNKLAQGPVKVGSLGSVLTEWFECEIEPKYRRPKQVQRYLDRLPPALLRTPMREVTRQDMFRFLKRYAKPDPKHRKRGGPVAANRCLTILKAAFNWAVVADYTDASAIDELTPRFVGGKETAGDRVLTDAEIAMLWHTDSDHTPLMRFLLLTGQRIGEAQRATLAHIDLTANRWTIPAEHSKNGKAHWCALSPAARAIVEAQPTDRETVFGLTSDTAVQAWVKRWCNRENIELPFTPHDCRRTASTRMNELGIPVHVVEKILNHSLQGVLAVYNRAEYVDEREAAMMRWETELLRIVGSAP